MLARRLWDDGTDWLFLAGVILITAGTWQLSEAAGKVVLGLFCLAAGLLIALRSPLHR